MKWDLILSTMKPSATSVSLVLLAIQHAFGPAAAAADEGYRLDQKSAVYQAAPQKSLDLRDAITLEAWVKADRMSSAGGRILDKTVPGTQEGYMIDTHPGNSLRLLNAHGMCTFDAKLPADRWSHVVGVFSASEKTMKLYLDGREVASLGGRSFKPMTPSRVPLCIGADPAGGNRFSGRIRRAAVYDRALGAEEIAARAKEGSPPRAACWASGSSMPSPARASRRWPARSP